MRKLVLHPSTKNQLELMINSKTQAIALVGADGIGKGSVGRYLISAILDIGYDELDNYPYFISIANEAAHISIEDIRHIQHFLELKTIGTKGVRRALLIEHAERMTTEAQNAILKTLEELPSDTVVVLTLSYARKIASTIISRVQLVRINSPNRQQMSDTFRDDFNDKKIEQAYELSDGLPGLMHSLLFSEDHPLLPAVEQAKKILQSTTFERLCLVDGMAKQKDTIAPVVQALIRMADVAIRRSAQNNNKSGVKRWQSILAAAADAQEALVSNAQSKLILTNLILTI